MYWSTWWTALEDAEIENRKCNWSSPFLKNVIETLNVTLIGPQRVEIYNGTSFSTYFPHAEQYGLASAIVLISLIKLIYFKRENDNEKHKFTLSWPGFINPRVLLLLFSFIMFTCALPLVFLILGVCYINKKIVAVILKIKYGKKFVELLNGTDTIWALEEDNSKSIINVITLVEIDNETFNKNKNALYENVRDVILKKLFGNACSYPKLLYKRKFEKGYFFWELNNELHIDDCVRLINFTNIPSAVDVTDEDLKEYVSEKSNTNLPSDNSTSWEILIGNRPITRTSGNTRGKLLPILFRIHHSLGDGVVLLQLLLRTIADEKYVKELRRKQFQLKKLPSIIIQSISKTMTIINMKEECSKVIKSAMRCIYFISMIPISLMDQFLRPCDENAMHGPSLSGKKLVTWISENDNNTSLLKMMKEVKKKIPGATFSDLFVTALSSSLNRYFKQCCSLGKIKIPEYITAVVPVRADNTDLRIETASNKPLKLENKFSVAYLTVPMNQTDSSNEKSFSHLQRLADVRRETNKLRNSADYQVNYWLISVVGNVLPESILRPLLYSEQATMVISNLPGPSGVTISGGHVIHDMAFFIPHRGTTGVGVTLLTINERIHLGLIADASLISSSSDVHDILKNILDELMKIDNLTLRRLQSHEDSLEMHT